MTVKTKYVIAFVAMILMGGVVVVKNSMASKSATISVETNTTIMPNMVHGVGTLEAKEIVVLAPKTVAKIAVLYADEGDRVKANQVLATMELSELSGNMLESRATIAKSRSQVLVQKGIIDDLEAKQELADATLTRYATLLKGGFVTQAEFDTAHVGARSAKAQLKSAKENLVLSSHDIEKNEAILIAQKAKIEDLTLRSPFDAIVVSRNAEAGSTVGAGVSVFRLANPKTLWVKIYVDERQSGLVRIGQKATVRLRSFPKNDFSGKVARIGVESDRITEEKIVYIRIMDTSDYLHLGEQAEADIYL